MKYCTFCGEYYEGDDVDHLIKCDGDFEKPYGGVEDYGIGDDVDNASTCNCANSCDGCSLHDD